MKTVQKKASVKKAEVNTEDLRTPAERFLIQKSGEQTIYIKLPASRSSKAVLRLYQGVCRETGRSFFQMASQVLDEKTGAWKDPVLDLHPDLQKERAQKAWDFRQEKAAVVASYPPEVKALLEKHGAL